MADKRRSNEYLERSIQAYKEVVELGLKRYTISLQF